MPPNDFLPVARYGGGEPKAVVAKFKASGRKEQAIETSKGARNENRSLH